MISLVNFAKCYATLHRPIPFAESNPNELYDSLLIQKCQRNEIYIFYAQMNRVWSMFINGCRKYPKCNTTNRGVHHHTTIYMAMHVFMRWHFRLVMTLSPICTSPSRVISSNFRHQLSSTSNVIAVYYQFVGWFNFKGYLLRLLGAVTSDELKRECIEIWNLVVFSHDGFSSWGMS